MLAAQGGPEGRLQRLEQGIEVVLRGPDQAGPVLGRLLKREVLSLQVEVVFVDELLALLESPQQFQFQEGVPSGLVLEVTSTLFERLRLGDFEEQLQDEGAASGLEDVAVRAFAEDPADTRQGPVEQGQVEHRDYY